MLKYLTQWEYWILAVATAFVYANSLSNELTLDDTHAIVENKIVRSDGFYKNVWTTDYWGPEKKGGRYRPLTSFTFGLNHQISGLDPFGYHLTNVLLHLLTVFLVFRFASKFLQRKFSLVVALVFALHPVMTECVASVVGRAEILMTIFFLLGLLFGSAYLEIIESQLNCRLNLFLCISCYALSLVSKENAITMPLILALTWFFFGHNKDKRTFSWAQILPKYPMAIGLFLVCIAYITCRYLVFGKLGVSMDFESNPLIEASGFTRMMTALFLYGKYFLLLIFPSTLSAEYTYNQIPLVASFWDPRNVISLAWISLAVFIFMKNKSILHSTGFGFFMIVLVLLPVSNLFFPIGTIFAERLIYLPCVGFGFVLGGILQKIFANKERPRQYIWALVIGVLIAYFIRTAFRNTDWKNHLTLFQSAVASSPNSARLHRNLASEYWKQKDFKTALVEVDRSITIYPKAANAFLVKGNILMEMGHPKKAKDAFAQGELLDPQLKVAPLFLGRALAALGLYEQAESAWQRAIDKRITWADPWKNIANLHLDKNPTKAAHFFEEAVKREPDDLDALLGWGTALHQQGNHEKAGQLLERALKQFPSHPQIQFNLAMVYLSSGQNIDRAKFLLKSAYSKSPPPIKMRIKQILNQPNL